MKPFITQTLRISVLSLTLSLVWLQPTLSLAKGGSEVGDKYPIEVSDETYPQPQSPSPAPSDKSGDKAGDRTEQKLETVEPRILKFETSATRVREGDVYQVKILVADEKKKRVNTCSGELATKSGDLIRVPMNQCKVRRHYSGVLQFNLSYRFPNPTVTREYQFTALQYGQAQNVKTIYFPIADTVHVYSNSDLPPLKILGSWVQTSSGRTTVRAVENFDLVILLQSSTQIANGTLIYQTEQAHGTTTGFLELAAGTTFSQQSNKDLLLIRIPLWVTDKNSKITGLNFSELVIQNEALQRAYLQLPEGIHVSVLGGR